MDERVFGQWRKSTRSGGADNCVEIATCEDRYVGVRDSKDPGGPNLIFSPGVWAAFIDGAKQGEFDL